MVSGQTQIECGDDVPREAVGERCELFYEVNLLDIDMELGDVLPCEEVVAWLDTMRT